MTIAECVGDALQLWFKINKIIKPPTVSQFRHAEYDPAKHFTSKVDKILASTASVGPPDISSHPSSVLSTLSSFQHVTVSEIYKLIRRAPCKHCPLDPVPTWLVKRAADVLAPVITTICNASLQSGCFPDFYKQARVTARQKKPSLNPDDLNSFRSISNLPFLSKIIERVVVKQFIHHADQNGLLLVRQSAYRRSHSTESAVLVVHNIVRAIDDGHVAALALLDHSSAFDSVDHSTLLSILRSRFSVTEQPLEWFRSYLTGRTQVFTTHSGQTHPIPLTPGVPQGSSLGPAQFISYTECTTNIFSLHSVQYDMFAVDTQSYSYCAMSEMTSPKPMLLCDFKSTRRKPSSSGSVRFTRQLDQNTTVLSINSRLWVCN